MFSYEEQKKSQTLRMKAPEKRSRRSNPAMAVRFQEQGLSAVNHFPWQSIPVSSTPVIQRKPDGNEEDEIPPIHEIKSVGKVMVYDVGCKDGKYYIMTPDTRVFFCPVMEDGLLFFSYNGVFISINLQTRDYCQASYYNLDNRMVVFNSGTADMIVDWSTKDIYHMVTAGSMASLYATKDEARMLIYQPQECRFFFSRQSLAEINAGDLVLFQYEKQYVLVFKGVISPIYTMDENGSYSLCSLNGIDILLDHEFGKLYICDDEMPLLRRTRKHDSVCRVYSQPGMPLIYEDILVVDPTVQKLYRYTGITFMAKNERQPLYIWFASDTETIQVEPDLSQAVESGIHGEIHEFQETQDVLSGFIYDMLNQQWEYTGEDVLIKESPIPNSSNVKDLPEEKEPFDFMTGKLITNLTAVVVVAPVVSLQDHGTVGATELRITEIMLGNGDRPPTRFDSQMSHTVAWTLIRAWIEALDGKPVLQFLMMMREKFLELLYFMEQTEGRKLMDSVMKLKQYIPGKELLLNVDAVKAPETVMKEEQIVLQQMTGSVEAKQGKTLTGDKTEEEEIWTETAGQEEMKAKREIRFENDTIGDLIRAQMPVANWNRLCSQLLVTYLQIYQLSQAAVYNKKSAGRGEGGAMLKLYRWEDLFSEAEMFALEATEITEIQDSMEALLDVEFRINMLGVWEYAFAVSEWINMLRQVFPTLMGKMEEVFLGHFLGKQLAKSFYTPEPEKSRGPVPKFLWDKEQPPTVRDLLQAYEEKREELWHAAALPEQSPLEGPLLAAYVPDSEWNDPEGYLLGTHFTSHIFLQPVGQVNGIEQTSTMEQLFVSAIRISDRDRARTQFLSVQRSHTVAWTLTREALLAFQGKRLPLLVFFLEKSLTNLVAEAPEEPVREAFMWELKRGNFYIQKLKEGGAPLFMMMSYAGSAVRSYVIISQAAISASYYNPQESTPLGHGEARRMALLRQNESALDISNLAHTYHTEQKIIETALGLFDAKVTDQFTLQMARSAHYDFLRKLIIAFPNIMRVFGPKIAVANLESIEHG